MSFTAFAAEVVKRIDSKTDLALVPFRVAGVAPLTVFLAGSPDAIPGVGIAGQSLAVNDTGYALWSPSAGIPPLCIETI